MNIGHFTIVKNIGYETLQCSESEVFVTSKNDFKTFRMCSPGFSSKFVQDHFKAFSLYRFCHLIRILCVQDYTKLLYDCFCSSTKTDVLRCYRK